MLLDENFVEISIHIEQRHCQVPQLDTMCFHKVQKFALRFVPVNLDHHHCAYCAMVSVHNRYSVMG